MLGPYTHRIDPVLADLGGVYLWWYGLGFALGFLHLRAYLARHRHGLQLSAREAWTLTLAITIGVLAGGRVVEVAFDEWPFYREHLWLIPAYWLGGMATHGLLIGAAAAIVLFAWITGTPFRPLADALVIPGAFLMGMGRIGNFIDGQIVGSVTDVWWAVKFPDAEGYRHPVVLYDGVKNLLLMAYLAHVRHRNPTPGATAARFVFWYAAPRIVIDLWRDYPTHRLAMGTGQTLNIVMAILGAALLWRSRQRRLGRLRGDATHDRTPARLATGDAPARVWQPIAFVALLALCLTIPSNWTQDIPARYGQRHAGLRYSRLYPRLDTRPRSPASSQPSLRLFEASVAMDLSIWRVLPSNFDDPIAAHDSHRVDRQHPAAAGAARRARPHGL